MKTFQCHFVLCSETSIENGQFVIRDLGHLFLNHPSSKAQNEVEKPVYVLLSEYKSLFSK